MTKVTKTFRKDPKIQGKPVEEVPGIGKAIGRRLREAGIEEATDLLEIYREKTEKQFKKLIENCGGNAQHQNQGLQEWELTCT